MDPKKTIKSSGTKPGDQISKLTAGVKDLSVKQPSKPNEAKRDPKYDAGKLLLKKLEDNGLFKNLPKPGSVHKAPKIISTGTSEKSTAAPTVGMPTPVKPGLQSARPADKKAVPQTPSKIAPKTPATNQKEGPKDLKPAKKRN